MCLGGFVGLVGFLGLVVCVGLVLICVFAGGLIGWLAWVFDQLVWFLCLISAEFGFSGSCFRCLFAGLWVGVGLVFDLLAW